MAIKSFQTLAQFVLNNPNRNHSSRVLSRPELCNLVLSGMTASVAETHLQPVPGMTASVADAFLQPVPGMTAAVSDAIIQAVGSGTASLVFGATTLAFAATPVGGNTSMTVTISNPGTADLVITSLTPTGDFSVATIVEA